MKSDMLFSLQYLERCNRFEKIVGRLKETHLMQVSEGSASDQFVSKSIRKKRNGKEKSRDKSQVKIREEQLKKRSRRKAKDEVFFEELAETEAMFFHAVKRVTKTLSSRKKRALFTRIKSSVVPFKTFAYLC